MKNKISKILGWQINQTKSLIEFVYSNKNKPLTDVFENWAKANNRQPFSVRNYYYKLVKYVNENPEICKQLDIKKEFLVEAFQSKHFSNLQAVQLLEKILPNQPACSVRARCHHLANGDLSQMIRYQNKYRNLITHNKDLVEQVMVDLQNKGVKVRNPYLKQQTSKIVTMPANDVGLSDSEIQSLFNGLIRLVKNNTEKQITKKIAHQFDISNNTLQVALANLRKKDLMLQDITEENQKLKDDLKNVQQMLAKTKADNLSNLLQLKNIQKSQKMEDLKNFIARLTAEVEGSATQPQK